MTSNRASARFAPGLAWVISSWSAIPRVAKGRAACGAMRNGYFLPNRAGIQRFLGLFPLGAKRPLMQSSPPHPRFSESLFRVIGAAIVRLIYKVTSFGLEEL